MAATRRGTEQKTGRAERLQGVARGYLRGMTQVELAAEYGVSQGTISKDLAALRAMWLESALVDFDEARQVALAKIDHLEAEYWAAWETSKTERVKTATGKTDKGTSARVEKEQRDGNPQYLAGVQWCIAERIKLLGLYAPTKQELTGRGGGPIEVKGDKGALTLAYYEMPVEEWAKVEAIVRNAEAGAFGGADQAD